MKKHWDWIRKIKFVQGYLLDKLRKLWVLLFLMLWKQYFLDLLWINQKKLNFKLYLFLGLQLLIDILIIKEICFLLIRIYIVLLE